MFVLKKTFTLFLFLAQPTFPFFLSFSFFYTWPFSFLARPSNPARLTLPPLTLTARWAPQVRVIPYLWRPAPRAAGLPDRSPARARSPPSFTVPINARLRADAVPSPSLLLGQ